MTLQEPLLLEQALAAQDRLAGILPDPILDTVKAVLRSRLEKLQTAANSVPRRKQITVLFADLSSFTNISEQMDPEEVSNLLNAIWAEVDVILHQHGGRIDKHMGDVVMALWGADQGREDDAERAVEAALKILVFDLHSLKRRFSGVNFSTFGFQIAVHTGPVLLGTLGLTREFTAVGDTVNTASRLQNAAPVGGVLISQATYDMVRGLFKVEAIQPFRVKGKNELLAAYQVLAVQPHSYRMQRRGIEGIPTPLIGRTAELAYLQNAYDSAQSDRHMVPVLLLSESGMGKSRLMNEFEDHFNQPGLVFHTRGDPRYQDQPYRLIRDLFTDFCQIEEGDSAEIARQRLENLFVKWLGPAGLEMTAITGQLLGFQVSGDPDLREGIADPQQLHDQAFRAIRDLFEIAGAARSVVIYLDDLHWTDDGSLELLTYLIQNLQHTGVLVIMASRPALFERFPEWPHNLPGERILRLTPLSAQDSRALAGYILHRVIQIPDMLLDMLVEHAEGIPFYLEELIKMLIEQSIILPGPAEWQVNLGRLRGFQIPPSLTGVLQARLDHLEPCEDEAIQLAAVVGRSFWDQSLLALQPSCAPDLPRVLDALCVKGLIERRPSSALPEMQEFIFQQGILHEVAYERVLKMNRRPYHNQIAGWLVSHSADNRPAYAGLIAGHYEKAGENAFAALWMARVGDQARAAYVQTQALQAYQRALELSGASLQNPLPPNADPALLCVIFESLSEVFNRQHNFPQSHAAVQAMLQTARAANDLPAQVRALCEWTNQARFLNTPEVIPACLSEAEIIVSSLPVSNPALQALVLWCKSGYAIDQAHYSDALNWLQQAGKLAQQAGDRERLGSVYNLQGFVYMFQGQVQLARAHMLQALEIHRSIGHQQFEADILSNIGETYRAENQFDQAISYYRQSMDLYRKISNSDGHSIAQSNLGVALVEQGHFQEGLEALQTMVQSGSTDAFGLSETYRYLAQAYLGLENFSEALLMAQEALKLSLKADVPERIGPAWRILGRVAVQLKHSVSPAPDQSALTPDECFQASLDALNAVEGLERERAETLQDWERWQPDQEK